MASFVNTMRDWRRMCETIQLENWQTSSGSWCKGCPVQGVCVFDTEIKDTTDKELVMIDERVQSWAAEHPEPVYPSFLEWLHKVLPNLNGQDDHGTILELIKTPIPADIAQKLGIEPKER